jgi:hypothetical protein
MLSYNRQSLVELCRFPRRVKVIIVWCLRIEARFMADAIDGECSGHEVEV